MKNDPTDRWKSGDNPDEPLFMAIPRTDVTFQDAYSRAAATLPEFMKHLETGNFFCSAKLRFRDPDESQRLDEDRFVYLWLTGVRYHPNEKLFSGTFFAVPVELQKWHQVGEDLGFSPEDIFDWMVIENGHLYGGFTIRATRDRLPEHERQSYDRHIGVTSYEPI